ncbi:hypothetical protein BN1723_013256 [Verticillium longisporum]|uniref:RNA helicase n=3 Tax=Verticillium longisporum TaxID=100787 RepID=A0A0G4LQR2_VERLO|nr:hypothetical protein BN1723_013256 [Verticillium longisporum]
MDDLLELELLSLVSKVTSELQNHMGVSDKTLAEFIIAQRVECADTGLAGFQKKLAALGADVPPSFVESIDRLVLAMHPKLKGKKTNGADEAQQHHHRSAEEKEQIFKGLAVPDKEVGADAFDDTFALLEGLEGRARQEKTSARKRSRSPEDDRESRRKRRDRSRSKERRRRRRSRSRSLDDEHGPALKQRSSRRRERDYNDYEDDDRLRRPPPTELDDAPQIQKVYPGRVTGVKDFGAFVNLQGVRGKSDGLVHVSQISEQRVNHPSDILSRDQQVWVKVISVDGNRIGLSMKQVDQETGMDLVPQARISSGANMEALGGGGADRNGNMFDAGIMPPPNQRPQRQKKRMTSPERWEIRQLIASGVAKASDYPDLNEDYNATLRGDGEMELEEEVDIEVREEEPPFLAGQTKQSLELSPIRVVKAPDGSMNRAAMSGTALAKERKELKQQEAEAAAQEENKVDLSTQWNDPMADPDKRKFASDMRNARQQAPKPDAVPEWKRAVQPKDQSFGKRTDMSMKQQRESLPVFAFRQKFLDAVNDHQVMVVIGETGSGKTTQLTQYLAEGGFANHGVIGCTQPRRVAAMSVAKRVAEEVGCPLGEEVGYTIRFEDRTSPATRIKYMTDGMLQREILVDPDLKRYSVIMLDEAHERTISTDVLFALLKKTMARRKDLKVIATSATLDADKFSSYFNGCPIFTIPGRTFPVEVLYSREPESDYLDAALVTVMQIHLTEPPGDILLFLTGQEEIDTSCEILFERMKALGPNVPELLILPVYSALPNEMQSRIFDPAPPGCRKVVIATNIAETSITIDNIYFVVDPGFVKQNAYDPKLGMDSLVVTPISQAQANQRAGRAGRTGPGKCFRLYTEAAYQSEMLPTTIPEIQRQNLSHTILMLKAMGINDLLHFDFMDPPPINTMLTALEELYALSALDDEGLLTRLGRKMADFPMEPSLAKVLIMSIDMNCSAEMLIIVAMLNLPNVFYRPKEKQTQADQKKAKFHDPAGDHLTLLNVYNSWKQSSYSSPWCFENFIQARSMKRAKDVHDQLVKIMDRYRHPVVSCGRNTQKVRQALCSGFFRNAARKDPQEGYKTLTEQTPVYLHPSSALFGKQADDMRNAKQQAPKPDAVPEWKRAVQPKDQSFGKRTDMSMKQQRESLPVFAFRQKFLDAVNDHQVMVVIGETGSGKTTQLTQYLAEGGFANHGVIGCTQPRRVAAMSVAKRVAEEVGCPLGEEVGYTIRFEDRTSPATRIKYMTDGMLQREILVDPDLKRYSVIMLDEAHERTISTDVLFALLKKTMARRKDLKVIATSATLDADKFSSYFNGCPIFTIPGRTFPVEVLYSREPESDYLDAALVTVMQIHLTEPPGDILLLTGQEEIDTSCEILFERMKALGPNVPELLILPVYSALPNEMQSRIFDPAPPGCRKVVIATNIAETSITIDNIYFVVDPGFVKQNAYDPKLGMDSLVVTPISQAQANQRAGRAGRTGPGKCFRLYTEAAYQSEMLPTTIPEIQRQNLSHTILMLKAMGINDLLHFDFMDPPPINTMLTALEELYALSALDDEGLLTRLGRKMADFPMEPSLAKVLIMSIDMNCSAEMLIIVAMLNLPNVFYRPKEKQTQADQKKAKFHDPAGDHLTLLNVYNSWKQSSYSSPWCFENFIQARSMKRAKDVHDQLVKIMDRYRHPVVSCGRNTQKVRQALCSGFFRNAARKDPQEGYKTLTEQTPVYLHPSSALFGKQAEWVIYHTLVLTTKEYMHCSTSIEPKWLVEAAPTFFKVAPTDKLSKRKKAERIQPLYNKFAGEDDWRLSAQKKGGRSGGGGTWG